MTTIAVRGGVIAFDGRSTDDAGMVILDVTPKAVIIPHLGCIYAGAGAASGLHQTFLRLSARRRAPWLDKVEFEFKADPDVFAIALTCNALYVIDEGGWFPVSAEFYAMGGGAEAAYAAMHMGATAEQAVEAAVKVNVYSGPPVSVLRVEDIPCYH